MSRNIIRSSELYRKALHIMEHGGERNEEMFNKALSLFIEGANMSDDVCYSRIEEILRNKDNINIMDKENLVNLLQLLEVRKEIDMMKTIKSHPIFPGPIIRKPINKLATGVFRNEK